MRYKAFDHVIPMLKDYPLQKKALALIPTQIKTLELKETAIRAVSTDAAPVSGGTSKREDALIANIFERQKLERNLEIAKRDVKVIEDALQFLNLTEIEVVDRLIVNRQPNSVERLCESLGYEKTKVYDIRTEALIKLAKALTGVAEM